MLASIIIITFYKTNNNCYSFVIRSIVQACLALSFYQALSPDLIQRVFNIDFVTRLEKELALTYDMVNMKKYLEFHL